MPRAPKRRWPDRPRTFPSAKGRLIVIHLRPIVRKRAVCIPICAIVAVVDPPGAGRLHAGMAAVSAQTAEDPATVQPLTLERAVALAIERGPTLLAARSEVAVARARLEGASLLSQTNPEVDLGAGPRRGDARGSLDVDVGIRQRIEIFGQRSARIDEARESLGSNEARLAGRRLELVAEVRESFGRALAAEQALALADQTRKIAADSLRAAEERRLAGAASRIEVNTARGEVGRASREWAVAVQRRSATRGALRLLLGIEPGVDMQIAGTLQTVPRKRETSAAALVQQALDRRPELVAARRTLEAARAEQRLAAREALPVPRVGALYRQEEGAQVLMGTLGLDLPVFQRNQAARGASAARLAQAAGVLAAFERAVKTEVGVTLERHRAAASAAEAFSGGTLAAVEENAGLVTEAYRAGKVDFYQLLLIRREGLEVRQGYIDALEELNAAEAQLDRAIGVGP